MSAQALSDDLRAYDWDDMARDMTSLMERT